jgi:hypothetical protein
MEKQNSNGSSPTTASSADHSTTQHTKATEGFNNYFPEENKQEIEEFQESSEVLYIEKFDDMGLD